MKKPVVKIIKNPRITEKGTFVSENNVYIFDVQSKVTKNEVKEAIFELYKVKPAKVNISNIPAKIVTTRGLKGRKSGGRKAYVYLKEGDKIEFI